MAVDSLVIKRKVEDAIVYAFQALTHFPKSERFTSAAEIRKSFLRILALIVRANKTRNRLPLLYDLDVELDVLRSLVRVSQSMGYLPFGKYEQISMHLAEIGRMLGGWIKSSS